MHFDTRAKHCECISVRLLTSLAPMFHFSLCSFNVTQAYLQCDTNMAHTIDIHPPTELCLPAMSIHRLWKPLYGSSDAVLYWHQTVRAVLRNDLLMRPTGSDSSLYMYFQKLRICGVVVTQEVDVIKIQCSWSNEQEKWYSRNISGER